MFVTWIDRCQYQMVLALPDISRMAEKFDMNCKSAAINKLQLCLSHDYLDSYCRTLPFKYGRIHGDESSFREHKLDRRDNFATKLITSRCHAVTRKS